MMAQLGIPEGLKPLLCASFGYAVKEEPAKEHKEILILLITFLQFTEVLL
jgi:hypothetical protein